MNHEVANVALLCAGLDSSIGGFESHMRNLHEALGPSELVSTTLFKSSGATKPAEVRLRSPDRASRTVRYLKRLGRDRFFWESLLFCFAFAIHVTMRRTAFDRIVVIEPVVRRCLYPIVPFLPGKPELVWTHGLNNDPAGYVFDCDVVHEVNIENFELAGKVEKRSANVVLIPHFCMDTMRQRSMAQCREAMGISTERVLLCVGRIETAVKRVNHVVQEAAALGEEWSLVLCGPLVDLEILDTARQLLGDRVHHTQAAPEDMHDVYPVADVLVHASINEGFGLVLLEAMRAGVPIVAHKRPLFDWIVGDGGLLVDMREVGALSNALRDLERSAGSLQLLGTAARKNFSERFSWTALRDDYEAILTGTQPRAQLIPASAQARPFRDRIRSRGRGSARDRDLSQDTTRSNDSEEAG